MRYSSIPVDRILVLFLFSFLEFGLYRFLLKSGRNMHTDFIKSGRNMTSLKKNRGKMQTSHHFLKKWKKLLASSVCTFALGTSVTTDVINQQY